MIESGFLFNVGLRGYLGEKETLGLQLGIMFFGIMTGLDLLSAFVLVFRLTLVVFTVSVRILVTVIAMVLVRVIITFLYMFGVRHSV